MYKNKMLILGCCIALGFAAAAQSTSKVSIGLRGGVDFQNINGKDHNNQTLKFDMVPRFNAGLIFEIPLANEFVIQPGVLYTTKGAKTKDNYLGLPIPTEFNLTYIEVPLNFVYKPTLGQGKMLLGFGPYLAYAIAGDVEYTANNIQAKDKIEFKEEYSNANPFDARNFKPFDYGANFLFGYQFAGGLSAQLNAQLGLAQIKATNTLNPNSDVLFKNTGFGISLGYMF